jgi:hypothetical protein
MLTFAHLCWVPVDLNLQLTGCFLPCKGLWASGSAFGGRHVAEKTSGWSRDPTIHPQMGLAGLMLLEAINDVVLEGGRRCLS